MAAGSKITSEYRFLDADDPDAGFRVFSERRPGLEYSLDHAVIAGQDRFLVLHNHTGPDFELGTAPVAPTAPEDWTPLIPHDPAVRLEDVDAFAGHLVVHQRSEGLTQLRVLELGPDGVRDDYLVEFDHEVYTVGSGGNPGFAQPTVRLGYTTMAVPSSIYDYDVRSRELTLLRRAPVLGGYDPDDYEEHRLWATAEDGERVPISIVCRRGAREARPDSGPGGGTRPVPTLLYGYGAYESSMDPYFSVARLSLLDRGAAFAIAHVRGGGEMGRRWYDDGKLLHKQHTFSDFVACARHLVETGWTTPEGLVAEGASAGGLLMGAIANQAPELFGGVVAGVPFVDTLTSMLDATLPLTVTEYDEWGNPEEDPEVYDYIASYAPYDNVAAVDLSTDPGRDVAQRHPGALRRAGQVGREAPGHRAERRRGAAPHRDVGRPRRGLGALQVLARPGLHAGLDPGPDGPRGRRTGPIRRPVGDELLRRAGGGALRSP